MKKGNKKNKTKDKKKINEKVNNSNISEENDLSLSNINNQENQSKILNQENNNPNNLNNEEKDFDLFEKDLNILDEYYKKGYIFEPNYEPTFSINYPNQNISSIPLFTPSTRLNNALQIGEKNETYIYYYTHKKSLYPTIYNQLIGISGPNTAFMGKVKDFIYANATSLIFTNQNNFINLKKLLNEYVEPLLKENKIDENQKQTFTRSLLNNIHIHEYLTYEELFGKLNELNIYLMEHKINNVGLIIIDGINSINSRKVEFIKNKNDKNYKLFFYKSSNLNKGDQNPNKKNKRNSSENKKILRENNSDNTQIKQNLFGNDYVKMENNNSNFVSNEGIQKSIVNLIMNYQEKYNFNLILTVFDYPQDNFYKLNISGKASYKEMNKNTYTVNCKEVQKENCYFTFKLPKEYFPKKITFIEPINLSVNYNQTIFGLITNPINTHILEFQVFKKEKNDYRPTRILGQIEYEYK